MFYRHYRMLLFNAVCAALRRQTYMDDQPCRSFPELNLIEAYLEVPYLVEDGLAAPMEYYRDFIIMFIFFGSVYLITFANFFVMKLSIMDWFKKNTTLFEG